MNTTVAKREEKEIPIKLVSVRDRQMLKLLCHEHNVLHLPESGDYLTIKLTQDSRDLLDFATKIDNLGLLIGMSYEKKRAYLYDLSTLECP